MKSSSSAAGRFVGAASVTLLLVGALAGCSRVKNALQPATPSPPAPARLSDQQQAALYQQQGVMAKQDYLRLVRIQDGINRTQAITDSDVDFLISKLKSQLIQSAAPNTIQAENLILAHTYGTRPKRLTPAQRRRLYDAVLPYIKSLDAGVQVNAALALASTRDPRAVQVLQSLSRGSRYPLVRRDAADFLKQLQKVLARPGG